MLSPSPPGPGLAGALLVGITYAKALAFANKLPLIAVNHLEGHIHAVLLREREEGLAKAATMKPPSRLDEREWIRFADKTTTDPSLR